MLFWISSCAFAVLLVFLFPLGSLIWVIIPVPKGTSVFYLVSACQLWLVTSWICLLFPDLWYTFCLSLWFLEKNNVCVFHFLFSQLHLFVQDFNPPPPTKKSCGISPKLCAYIFPGRNAKLCTIVTILLQNLIFSVEASPGKRRRNTKLHGFSQNVIFPIQDSPEMTLTLGRICHFLSQSNEREI